MGLQQKNKMTKKVIKAAYASAVGLENKYMPIRRKTNTKMRILTEKANDL